MHKFYVINFAFDNRLKVEELEPVFTAIGDDWVRVSGLCWILWTEKPAPHVYTLIRGYLDSGDCVVISAIPNSIGDFYAYLPPWIWDWMNGKGTMRFGTGEEAERMLMLPKPQ